MRLVWRVMRVAMTILAVGILSSVLTIGTTAIVVDRYIQTALDKFQIPIERKPLTLTSMWGVLLGSEVPTASSHNQRNAPVEKNQDGSVSNNSGNTDHTDNNGQQATQHGQGSMGADRGTSTPSTDRASKGESGSHMAPDGSLPVMGGISSGQESKGREAIIVPPESISKSKDELSKEKKDQIFATLMKKLPQEDWQRISTLMEGGLTSSEVIEVEQILAKHLNDDEYKEMREWMVGASKTTDTANTANTKESRNEGTGAP